MNFVPRQNGVANTIHLFSFAVSSVSGRSVYLPADGLLLGQRHVTIMGLLLPNHRYFLDIRGEEIHRLHSADDGYPSQHVLVYLLGLLCSCCNVGKLLLYLEQPRT